VVFVDAQLVLVHGRSICSSLKAQVAIP
jgi:hypothetical protein